MLLFSYYTKTTKTKTRIIIFLGAEFADPIMDPTEYTPEKLEQWLAQMKKFDHIDIM